MAYCCLGMVRLMGSALMTQCLKVAPLERVELRMYRLRAIQLT